MRTLLLDKRKRLGKTQQQIAEDANISLKSYQRIERGLQAPSVVVAIQIAKSLDSTVESLFTKKNTIENPNSQ